MTTIESKGVQRVFSAYGKRSRVGMVLCTLMWLTGCLRMYKDGAEFDAIFRPWHPVTWLVGLLCIVPCALMGERLGQVLPVRLSKFWQLNADQLQWLTPFTDINTLQPFRQCDAKHVPLERDDDE